MADETAPLEYLRDECRRLVMEFARANRRIIELEAEVERLRNGEKRQALKDTTR